MITNEWIKKVNVFSRERKIKKSFNMSKEFWYDKTVPQKIKDSKIIEHNALIAKFMGYNVDDTNNFFNGVHYYYMTSENKDVKYKECTIENVRSCTEGFVWNYSDFIERRYDNCWDFLMPVVEKIEEMGTCHYVKIDRWIHGSNAKKKYVCTIYSATNLPEMVEFQSDNSRMESAYMAIVSFIKVYNKIKK